MIDVDEGNLKQGLLGLVIALVEIIKDALATQAFRRVENGRLTEAEVERLGAALADLDVAIAQIKEEHGVADAVQKVRDGLDDVVGDVVDSLSNPSRWREAAQGTEA
jgi:hypothetical protein